MSWLSVLTHTEGLTPDWLKSVGDKVAPLVVSAIPGGAQADALLNLTNRGGTSGTSGGLRQLASQTGANLAAQANAAYGAASTTASNQAAYANAATGAQLLLSSPVGLAALGVVAFLLLRRK